jgi:hypothetical protein
LSATELNAGERLRTRRLISAQVQGRARRAERPEGRIREEWQERSALPTDQSAFRPASGS